MNAEKGIIIKPFNITHLYLYADMRDAKAIANMLRRYTAYSMQHGYSKVVKENGTVYYSKVKTAFFDVAKSIVAIKKAKKESFMVTKAPNYDMALEVLESILVDRLKFKDEIPNTTDTFVHNYNSTKRSVPKKKHDLGKARVKRVNAKRKEKRKFSDKFNKTIYGDVK